MSRTPACEDAATIQARLRELQAERIAMLAGCNCPSSVSGEKLHVPSCPLRAPPSQAALALAVAMERLRARHKRRPMTEDEIIAEGIAAKYTRHRVLS